MATKKDLVEAYSFSRRRLVTAFVSGAPGGREVEPSRPGRTLIGGVALAVLLAAGALVLGIIKSPDNVEWGDEMLVSEKETGADYVNLVPPEGGDPVLRPIINITSAMLLLGSDVKSTPASADEIGDRIRGEPIGILQAPATPPRTSELVQSGWTACVGPAGGPVVGPAQGIQVTVSADELVTPTPDLRSVVRTADGRLFLVAESPLGWDRPTTRAYAYEIDAPDPNRFLGLIAVGGSVENAVPVPDDWITLFPRGGTLGLATFGLTKGDIGKTSTLADKGTVPEYAQVGDVLRLSSDEDVAYLVLESSTLRLDAFAQAVYAGVYPRGDAPPPTPIDAPPSGDTSDIASIPGAYWPSETESERPNGALCAQLDAVEDDDPGVHLARAEAGSPAAPVDLPTDEIDRTVESGSGAFVQSGDWDADGDTTLALVDDRGLVYRVGDGDERDHLGYSGVPDEVVPGSWLQLFDKGVPLTIDAARCPPTSSDTGQTCADD